ncbi:MAG TPA: thioredoxin domain-containing protein [Pyrinomonadaceae bacterium]|nr:thioredoxin domain-containing protein [Pyrinomonadaceae bacterium]
MKRLHLATLNSIRIVLVLALVANFAFAQTEDKVVAEVDGRVIRQQEVDELFLAQIMPLTQQLYAIRKVALENLVVRALLESEAAKRNLSLEELRKTLTAGTVIVKREDVENEYAENILAFAAMDPDEARERLRLDLETRVRLMNYKHAVEVLRQRAEVKVYLSEPRWPSLASVDGPTVLGAKDSLITIVEFADFQCPYCREAQRVLKRVLQEYKGEVRLVFKHLPLDSHSQAFDAARAAFCAAEQDRFWEYQEALFGASTLNTAALEKTAQELKLELPAFKGCLAADYSHDAVTRDKRDANRWGINSTPTFLVNGKMVQGAIDFDNFKSLIEQELTLIRTGSPSSISVLTDRRRGQ